MLFPIYFFSAMVWIHSCKEPILSRQKERSSHGGKYTGICLLIESSSMTGYEQLILNFSELQDSHYCVFHNNREREGVFLVRKLRIPPNVGIKEI